MRWSRCAPFLLAVVVFVLATVPMGPPAGSPAPPTPSSAADPAASVQVGDRRLEVSAPTMTRTMTAGLVRASVTVR